MQSLGNTTRINVPYAWRLLSFLTFAMVTMNAFAMNCGHTIPGIITGDKQEDAYSFFAAAGERVLIHIIPNDPAHLLMAKIVEPTDDLISDEENYKRYHFNYTKRVDRQFQKDGIYTLYIKGGKEIPAEYKVHLERLNENMRCAEFLECGKTKTGEVATSGIYQLYEFPVVAGERFRIVPYTEDGREVSFTLVKPDGRHGGLYSAIPVSNHVANANEEGMWAILVNSEPGPIKVHLQRLTEGRRCTETLECGEDKSKEITVSELYELYEFPVVAGERIRILPFTEDEREIVSRLIKPDGSNKGNFYGGAKSFVAEAKDEGIWAIQVKGTPGLFKTEFIRFAGPNTCFEPVLNCGNQIPVTTSHDGQWNLFPFNLPEGAYAYVHAYSIGESDSNPKMKIASSYLPLGLGDFYFGPKQFTALEGGEHLLLTQSDKGRFNVDFYTSDPAAECGEPLKCGEPVQLYFTHTEQEEAVKIEAKQGKVYRITAITPERFPLLDRLSLQKPDGDFADTKDYSIYTILPGKTSLTFTAQQTGMYRFWLTGSLTIAEITLTEEECVGFLYAAFGDSYAAATGATNSDPGKCGQSKHGYIQQVQISGLPDHKVKRINASCGGARIGDIMVQADKLYRFGESEPAPVLSVDTDLITIQGGGNDVAMGWLANTCGRNYSNWEADCGSGELPFFLPPHIDATIWEALKDLGLDELARRVAEGNVPSVKEVAEAALNKLPDKLDRLFNHIAGKAPNAEIIVVNYPLLFPEENLENFDTSNCLEFYFITRNERVFLNEVTRELNALLNAAARRHYFHYVQLERPFDRHGPCADIIYENQEWVSGAVGVSHGEAFHPNDLGNQVIAREINHLIKDKLFFAEQIFFPNRKLKPQKVSAAVDGTPQLLKNITQTNLHITTEWPAACNSFHRLYRYSPSQPVRLHSTGYRAEENLVITLRSEVPDKPIFLTAKTDLEGTLDQNIEVPALEEGSIIQVEIMGIVSGTVAVGSFTIGATTGLDSDGDGVPDICDNCPNKANRRQIDTDLDQRGDMCDGCINDPMNDTDSDGLCAEVDPCPFDKDNDSDSDNICGDRDNCPELANPDQSDQDSDRRGDACDLEPLLTLRCGDTDSDGCDDCAAGYFNPLTDGIDDDADGRCEAPLDPLSVDADADSVPDFLDYFPADGKESCDTDFDGTGDNRDLDDDNDGIPDWWEEKYGLNRRNPYDARWDPDGDDVTNLEEFLNETHPFRNDKLIRALVPLIQEFILD
ncbi:MAG: hypothetical protein GY703_18385 [Gammaproteobacteria bacterium]|nr:hypothetical protein [Gammaproteobacteria bacterium]